MITYEVKLELSEAIADGTMAFHFSKPRGFTFKPWPGDRSSSHRSPKPGRRKRPPHIFIRQCSVSRRCIQPRTPVGACRFVRKH